MSFVLDLMIPGAETILEVLSLIKNLCSEVAEGQEACEKLHDRLKTIFEELERMDKNGQLPSSEPVDKYKKMLLKYLTYLQHYRDEKLVNRLLGHRTVMDALAPIYEEIEMLFKMLSLASMASMMEFKQEWRADGQVSQVMMRAIFANTQALLAQFQALTKGAVGLHLPMPAAASNQTYSSHSDGINLVAGLLNEITGGDPVGWEQLLLRLVQACVDDGNRALLYKLNGVQVLTSLVRNGRTYLTKVYALECLAWSAIADEELTELELNALRDCVGDTATQEFASIVNSMQNGSGVERTEAAVRCACVAAKGDAGELVRSGIIPLLVAMLKNGSDAQKLWSAEALRNVAMLMEASRGDIVEQGAVGLLTALLLVGTSEHKHRAAYALGHLASGTNVSEVIAGKELSHH